MKVCFQQQKKTWKKGGDKVKMEGERWGWKSQGKAGLIGNN